MHRSSAYSRIYLPDNLPDEASPGDWNGLRSRADLNSEQSNKWLIFMKSF